MSKQKITIFTIPKKFEGLVDVHQRNAVNSWYQMDPQPEVILCCDDVGVSRMAARVGARYVPDILRNEFGTPLVSDAFRRIHHSATHELIAYVNADIILQQNFYEAFIRAAEFFSGPFMMIGQRWDVDVSERLNFACGWEGQLRVLRNRTGILHSPGGSDYFAGRRGLLAEMPPFAVGRCGWDNWAISDAVYMGIPIVDVSAVTVVIHQGIPATMHHQRTPEDMKYVRMYERMRQGCAIGNIPEAQWVMTTEEIRRR